MSAPGASPPELTARACVLGVVLSVVLAAANAYLGLYAGMTVSASIPAAVVSLGVLRLLGRGGPLENNIVQTAASAGESLAAGVIFTFPALVLLGVWSDFDYLRVTLLAGLGGLLGVLFTIPLRRALILEAELRFPEGVATAEVIRAGATHGTGLWRMVLAALAGGAFKLGESGLALWSAAAQAAGRAGASAVAFGAALSPALLSVGFIVGLNTAVLLFLGGVANWLVAIPLCGALGIQPAGAEGMTAAELASATWSQQTRYLGVGGMLVGGLWSVVKMRGALLAGVRSGLRAYRRIVGAGPVRRTERDVPMKWVLVLLVGSAGPLLALYRLFVGDMTVAAPMAVLMLVAGFLFSAVAAYMAGVVGSSNNPISGVTIATIVVASLLLVLLMGPGAAGGPAAAILIGAVVCCAAAIAGDNMQDLKAGHLLGATPWKQQVMQIVGTLAAAVVVAPVLSLLLRAYGFQGHASAKAGALPAPQAGLMAGVARGAFAGDLPWGFIAAGMALAAAVIVLDEALARAGSAFRTPVLAVAIGFYLPVELSVPIVLGGVVHALAARRAPPGAPRQAGAAGGGILLASGLITGEALMGIALAGWAVIPGWSRWMGRAGAPLGAWPGAAALAAIAWWLYAAGRRGDAGQGD